jgi:hypothetical protein
MRNAKMGFLMGGLLVILSVVTWAQTSPVADKKAATPDALKGEIEALRDAKVAWRKVEWRTCLLDALNEVAREKKPLFLWVLGGAPADGRC